VAFLVQDGEHAATMLDGVFADCYSRWGGRFSLIVPCVAARIPPTYWPWLEANDPDLIYSYVALSDADVLEIHERLSPAQVYFYRPGPQPRLDVFGFKPEYRFTPLSSLSGVFRLARHRRNETLPLRILDSWHTERPTQFLTDNFGTYHYSQATGIFPVDATAVSDRLIIVNPENFENRRLGVPRDLAMLPNELEAVRSIGDGRTISMATLSAYFAPKLDIRFGRWSGSFNLVIGDTFADRLLFWNARLLIPAWLDSNLCCLRITLAQLDNADFLAALVDLLNRQNHVNGGTGGPSQLFLRSCSVDGAQLASVATRLQAARIWSAISSETVATPDVVIPDANSLFAAREGNRFTGELFPNPGWTAFDWTAPAVRPPADMPDHLVDAPIRQSFTTGYWASDFILENENPALRLGEQRWMLPRRWRLAGAFKVHLVAAPPHADLPRARSSRDGRLTIFLDTGHPIASIIVPSPRAALSHALAVDGRHAEAAREYGDIIPPAKSSWLRAGNEDRYLTGVLVMAGGLEEATEFLLHPFLRGEFAKLGGVPSPTEHDTERTDNRLKKLAGRQAPYDVRKSGDRQALSNLIVRAARELKHPKAFVSHAALKKAWDAHREAYWAAQRQPATKEERTEWDLQDKQNFDACLIALRRRQMLFQGHRWTCRRCSHRNWQDFSDLSAELTCSVCKQARQAPIEIQWQFRPNEFLIECLRDHSTLSLVWLLHTLARRARASLIYVGPTEFGFSPDAEGSQGESDLLALLDGRALLCEAKSSWRDVRNDGLDGLANLALRLRPDAALLAVMEVGTGPAEKIAETRARLAAANISFEVLTPPPGDEYDSFLPYDH
jgi:hypothetical protein